MPQPVFHGICFDLFDTLVNVGQVPESVGRFTADILGIERERWSAACFGPQHNICERTDALSTLRALAHSIDPDIPEERIAEAAAVRQRRFEHALCYPQAQVLEVLGELNAKGYRLALVSNASTAEVRAWPRSPLAAHFHASVFSCECGSKKPERAIYELALQRLQVRGERCVFVGDGASDEHRGAAALGMTPVLLTAHLDVKRYARIQQGQGGTIRYELASIGALPALLETDVGQLGAGG